MLEYQRLLKKVLEHGNFRQDRTGVGAYSVFGEQSRYDLSAGFPVLTTKKLHLRSIIHELLWFLKGDTNIKYLHENKVTIWDEWADEEGNLGPVYGAQWRRWQGADGLVHDQIADVIASIKKNLIPAVTSSVPGMWPGLGDGSAALPSDVSVLCGSGPPELPALPKECGSFFGGAFQYRLLRAAYHDGGTGL